MVKSFLLALLAAATPLAAQVATAELNGVNSTGQPFHGYVVLLDTTAAAGRLAPLVLHPAAGACPPPAAPLVMTAALAAANPAVVVALNGSFSNSATSGSYKVGDCLRVWGPVKDAGVLLAPMTPRADGGGDPALLFDRAGTASIRMVVAADVAAAATVIGGQWNDRDAPLAPNGSLLLAAGHPQGDTTLPVPASLASRTAVGVGAGGLLILCVVEGRLPGHSVGLTLPDLAWVMAALGARDAINLDGGGSSAMLYRPHADLTLETRRLDDAVRIQLPAAPANSQLGFHLRQLDALEPFATHPADGAPDKPFQLYRPTTIQWGFAASH